MLEFDRRGIEQPQCDHEALARVFRCLDVVEKSFLSALTPSDHTARAVLVDRTGQHLRYAQNPAPGCEKHPRWITTAISAPHIDLYQHPAGRYPGDLFGSNAYSRVHARSTDLAIIRLALAEYSGEVTIFGDSLREALAQADGAPHD